MEQEIREIYKSMAQQIDLHLPTNRLNAKVEEVLTYDYKFPSKVDEFTEYIERLRKKILLEYIRTLTFYLETTLMEINRIESQNLDNKYNAIITVLEGKIIYDASSKIENFMDEYLMPYKRLSEIREYEDLYIDLRRIFLNYIEEVNEQIQINNSHLTQKLKNISYNFGNEELEKSNVPLCTELLGVNVDKNQNCLWVYGKNGEEKIKLKPLNEKGTVYAIDDETFFIIEENQIGKTFKICTRTQIIKEILFSKKRTSVSYKCGEIRMGLNFPNKKIVIKQGNEQKEFDLSEYDLEKEQELRELLGENSPDLIEFLERIEIIKTPAHMVK